MVDSVEQVREVYARYGLAMFQAQALERQLAMLLTTVFGGAWSQEEYDEELTANFEKTMGKLVNELLKRGASEALIVKISAELRLALKTRNSLAHNYFWQRAVQFTSFDGRKRMLDELTQYFHLFARLDDILTGLTDAWAHEHGVTESDFQEAIDELLAKGQHASTE